MAFYTKFAEYYESVFPYNQITFEFLSSYTDSKTIDILDVGCGTGHYTKAFSDSGFQATGIDLNPSMVEHAKKHYPKPKFHHLNMLDIENLNQNFDLIFCIGNTAAHLTAAEFKTFIHAVHKILRPGGKWIFQVRNWEYILQQKEYTFPLLQANEENIQFERTYTKITPDSLQFNTRLIVHGKVVFEDSVILYPLSSQSYLRIHNDRQFQFMDQYGSFKRTSYDPDIDSANIFVFQKRKLS